MADASDALPARGHLLIRAGTVLTQPARRVELEPRSGFQRARYLVPRDDWESYRSREQVHPQIREQALGLEGSDALELVASDGLVTPSLTGVATPGHTPDHRSFVVSSSGERLFILGDLTHSPVIALETARENTFDWDKPTARATRERVLANLEADAMLTGVGHYPHPGFGRFIRIDGRRRWVPIAAADAR